MKKMTTIYTRALFLISAFWAALFFPHAAQAQQLGCGDNFGFVAKFLCEGGGTTNGRTASTLNQVIGIIIAVLTIVGGLWFLFQIILAGYNWINAGGDTEKVDTARQKMLNSVIGLIIIVIAYFLVGLLSMITGFDILNPGQQLLDLIA